jgi:hypothetical protein
MFNLYIDMEVRKTMLMNAPEDMAEVWQVPLLAGITKGNVRFYELDVPAWVFES